jgi:hypothetical protein
MIDYDEQTQQEYDAESTRANDAIASMIASGENVLAYMRYGVPNCMFWPMPDAEVIAQPLVEDGLYSPRLNAWSKDRGCAICGLDRRLVTDHCHTTGLVRGYICRHCNTDEGTGNWASWMIRWRGGWNPGVLLGIEDEYYDITGQLVISEQGRRLRMSSDERAAYDVDKVARLRAAVTGRASSTKPITDPPPPKET